MECLGEVQRGASLGVVGMEGLTAKVAVVAAASEAVWLAVEGREVKLEAAAQEVQPGVVEKGVGGLAVAWAGVLAAYAAVAVARVVVAVGVGLEEVGLMEALVLVVRRSSRIVMRIRRMRVRAENHSKRRSLLLQVQDMP